VNIAYLDPPYSRYFQRLAARLAQRCGGHVVALLSSPAYRLYTDGDRALVWPAGTAAGPLPPLPDESAHATWSQTVDDRFLGAFWHAVAWFRQQFEQERIEMCLVFSDARPFSLAAATAARQSGVRCIYFERGAFRYATASLSTLGLNARFSLQRAQSQPSIHGLAANAHLDRRATESGLRWRFVRFIVANRLASLAAPERRRLQHKRFALGPYLRLAVLQWWNEHHLLQGDDARLHLEAGAPLLVVPLQLPGDSQMLLHSPFEGNQQFLDFVVGEARRVAPAVRVLVKRHPMDTRRYRMPPGATAVRGNLMRFAPLRPVVVCVNSTVGFEAAARGLRVICFGSSFYTADDPVVVTSLRGFGALLRARLGQPDDPAAGRALRAAVLRWYQAPGDVWSFNDDDIERSAEITLEHHRAVAPAPAAPAPVEPKTLPAAASDAQRAVA